MKIGALTVCTFVYCVHFLYTLKASRSFLSRSPHLLLYINNTYVHCLLQYIFVLILGLFQTFHNIHLILFQMHIYILSQLLRNYFEIDFLQLYYFHLQSIYLQISGKLLTLVIRLQQKYFSPLKIFSFLEYQ